MDEEATAWTPEILSRLREWESWATATVELHQRRAYGLRTRLVHLGVAAVGLSAAEATWLMATSRNSGWIVWTAGVVTAGAATVATGLQTFLRYGEEAEEHRQIAERWSGLRREIRHFQTLQPDDPRSHVDPDPYIADLRSRIEDASAKSRFVIGSGRWRETAAQQRLEFRAATIAAVAKRSQKPPTRGEPRESLFTPAVRALLEDWERRAAASADAHVAVGQRIASLNVRLGVPAVVMLAGVAASVLTLRDISVPSARIVLGTVSTFAAMLIALNTVLRTAERAAKHGITAEMWGMLRGEIADVTRNPPRRVQEDPKSYLDDVRRRMDELSAVSPDVGDRAWTRALAGEARRPPNSATDAADRFASIFPGVNLRVEDDAVGLAS